jgi:hypothetical protein
MVSVGEQTVTIAAQITAGGKALTVFVAHSPGTKSKTLSVAIGAALWISLSDRKRAGCPLRC